MDKSKEIIQLEDLPNWLRSARLKSGYTQKGAAEAAGFTQSYLSMLESGKRGIEIGKVKRLCEVYGIQAAILFPTDAEETEEESGGVAALRQLEKLAVSAGSKQLSDRVDSYIEMCVYVMLRTIYLSNPRNSHKIFSLSDDEVDKLRKVLKGEPERILAYINTSQKVSRRKIEPTAEDAGEFRRLIEKIESKFKGGD